VTIAACYLSNEGAVFGADSTTTFPIGSAPATRDRHYDYAQKVFQVGGHDSMLGVVLWGMAGFPELSYRTLIAHFAQTNYLHPAASLLDVATQFSLVFWQEYTTRRAAEIQRVQHLQGQAQRSPEEAQELLNLRQAYSGGFCLGGNLLHDPTPQAFEIRYDPRWAAPTVRALEIGKPRFWGSPNLINRLIAGIDPGLLADVLRSSHWTGSREDLLALMSRHRLTPPGILPIREAIDWVHATLYSTIKTIKFSQLPPTCGGPVEVAVVTTDRPFRWVRHKTLGVAISLQESV
jgi:hypothetical protein